MITPGLERMIQEGKARMHTFTYGGGAVGRIPCPKGSFLIIHHFDYWHFIDVPEVGEDAPAVGGLIMSNFDETTSADGTFSFGALGGFVVNVDFQDIAVTEYNVQSSLDLLVGLGWVVDVVETGENEWTFTFTTTTPGEEFNGIIPGLTFPVMSPQPVIESVPFAGGEADGMSVRRFLTHASHQVEFRSSKGRNTFIIHEPVQMNFPGATPDANNFSANLGGVYEKDTYLVHTESVQINVLGVPDVSEWGITFAPLDEKSKEFPEPVGYGIAGTPSEATVREIVFDSVAATQQYLPLTQLYDSTTITPTEYREQFKIDVNALNALYNPVNTGGIQGSFKTYPLINIDYLVIDAKYNQFVKASNG